MKCSNCGNEGFIDIKLDSNDISMKACKKCGHIEYFYRLDKLKMLAEIDLLSTQSESLEIIAANSYQTVEAQKEAEEKIEAIEAKILKIKKKINALDNKDKK